jgi:hypothetical protein|tara:strand:- start:273 stop:485 length:213 start_codon:yes stop_codon:yes gene_type:complete
VEITVSFLDNNYYGLILSLVKDDNNMPVSSITFWSALCSSFSFPYLIEYPKSSGVISTIPKPEKKIVDRL